ncbi:hypothetical protein V6N13_028531 [Hibiscus sabdariffa]|uniref:Uncharacterized protein n=1 Tax=Hibiscus sabdariffa TaxID=183260 RepID=A0ABR2DA62_9ROSI
MIDNHSFLKAGVVFHRCSASNSQADSTTPSPSSKDHLHPLLVLHLTEHSSPSLTHYQPSFGFTSSPFLLSPFNNPQPTHTHLFIKPSNSSTTPLPCLKPIEQASTAHTHHLPPPFDYPNIKPSP